MFTPLSPNAVSAYSRPQIYFPETQRLGTQKKEAEVQKPTVRQIQPKASTDVRVSKSPAGDSFQSSRPSTKAKSNVSEQSTPDDLPTKAFTGLGASVGNIFGIQF
jgi:hypothetical protein